MIGQMPWWGPLLVVGLIALWWVAVFSMSWALGLLKWRDLRDLLRR